MSDLELIGLRRQVAELEDAVHKAFNQFENITVASTLEIAKDRAHSFIGWAYKNLPGYTVDGDGNAK